MNRSRPVAKNKERIFLTVNGWETIQFEPRIVEHPSGKNLFSWSRRAAWFRRSQPGERLP